MADENTETHDHLRGDDDVITEGAQPTLVAPDAAPPLEEIVHAAAEGGPGNVTTGLVTREVPESSGQVGAEGARIEPEGV